MLVIFCLQNLLDTIFHVETLVDVFLSFSIAFLEGPSIEAVRVIHEAPSGKVTSQPRFDSGAPVIAVLWKSFLVTGRGHVTCAYLLMGNCDERRLSGTGESCPRHASLAKL